MLRIFSSLKKFENAVKSKIVNASPASFQVRDRLISAQKSLDSVGWWVGGGGGVCGDQNLIFLKFAGFQN